VDTELKQAAEKAGELLLKAECKVATAESCTAGLVGMSLGAAANSGEYFTSGFITYTDHAKQKLLGVNAETLAIHTAVSEAVVREMVKGAVAVSGEAVSLAVSGYAGPDGGEDGTPAGTIWFAWHLPDEQVHAEVRHFDGDPEKVVKEAALFSLQRLTTLLSEDSSLAQ
jgi:PncC family amidohydrolase